MTADTAKTAHTAAWARGSQPKSATLSPAKSSDTGRWAAPAAVRVPTQEPSSSAAAVERERARVPNVPTTRVPPVTTTRCGVSQATRPRASLSWSSRRPEISSLRSDPSDCRR